LHKLNSMNNYSVFIQPDRAQAQSNNRNQKYDKIGLSTKIVNTYNFAHRRKQGVT